MDEGKGPSYSMRLIGERAVERGFCTRAQILDALRVQRVVRDTLGRQLFLGEILVIRDALAPGQLASLVSEGGDRKTVPGAFVNRRRFFGEIAVDLGFITPEDVFEALNVQFYEDRRGDRHRLIGEILQAIGKLGGAQVDEVLAQMTVEAGKPAAETATSR